MDSIVSDVHLDEDKIYREMSEIVDDVLGENIPESQKEQLFDYLISVAYKRANEYNKIDNFSPNSNIPMPRNGFPANSQQSINLYIPMTQFNPYNAPPANFYSQPTIPANQFPSIVPPNQANVPPQLYQQPFMPSLIQPAFPNLPLETPTSKPKSKHHHDKKEDKKHKHSKSKPSKTSTKKSHKDKQLVFQKEFTGTPFNGIFTELTQRYHGNINDQGIIEITGNKFEERGAYIVDDYSSLVNIDPDDDSSPCYDSEDEPNSYICFDFKGYLVAISAYTIKSSTNPEPSFLMNWVIEGSNDKTQWTEIDSRSNDRNLSGRGKVATFTIQNKENAKKKFRYIKLRMTGRCSTDNYYLELKCIEFFGSYFSK